MNRLLRVTVAGLLSGASGATPAQQPEPLGRLFSTPEQRLQLEELRREHQYGEAAQDEQRTRAAPEKQDPVFSRLTINGVVVRSDGVNSTWINGDRISGGNSTREGVQVRGDRDGSVRLTLPSGVAIVPLRPGQKIDVGSGAVLDAYQRDAGEEDPRSAFAAAPGKAGAADDPAAPAPEVPVPVPEPESARKPGGG